jgi:hypothetical protein
MKLLSLEPFIPSGSNFAASKELFQELGFTKTWDAGDLCGFEKDGCKFILQQYDNEAFAQNLMINVKIDDASAFYQFVMDKKLVEKFGIKIGKPSQQPYGKEVNIIDIAGVCWHFVE